MSATVSTRAAVLHELGAPLVLEELEIEGPRHGEVSVRLAASGVCRSDLHGARGVHPPASLPVVLGHEGAGVVQAVGPGVTHVRPGDPVILSWLPYCGHCATCAVGRPYLCQNLAWSDAGTMADGSVRWTLRGEPVYHSTGSTFAEHSVVPAQTAIPVPRGLPLEELALMGCAVMTGVGAVLTTAGVRPGETVAVIGCGGVGLSCVQGARIAGASRIVAVDVHGSKLALARELGATDVVDASTAEPVAAVLDLVPGGVEHAFEALGHAGTIEQALSLLAAGGQAVLVGMAHPDTTVALPALSFTLGERVVRGCWYGSCRPSRDFPLLLDLYRDGRLRLDPLVTRCSLDDVNDALAAIEAGSTARSVIVYG